MEKQAAIAELKKLIQLRSEGEALSSHIQNSNRELAQSDKKCDDAIARYASKLQHEMTDAKRIPKDNTDVITPPAIFKYVAIRSPQKTSPSQTNWKYNVLLAVSSLFTFLYIRLLFLAASGFLETADVSSHLLPFAAGGPAIGLLLYALYTRFDKSKDQAYARQCQEYQQSLEELHRLTDAYQTEADSHMQEIQQKLEAYEASYKKAVIQYTRLLSNREKREAEFDHFKAEAKAECERTKQKISESIAEAHARIEQHNAELSKINVIHMRYWDLAEEIVDLLETGRADTCKDALNLALELKQQREHQQAMRALEQERLLEERRRREQEEELAAARLKETERHNMEMELQQAAHNQAMAKAFREQSEAQKRASEKAEADRKAAGLRKCERCANYSKCSYYVKSSGAGLTCSSYRPY